MPACRQPLGSPLPRGPPTLQTAFTEFLLFLPDLVTSIVVFIASIDLAVHFWVDTSVIHRNEARDEPLKRIKKAFNENGIEVPFPVRFVDMEK